MRVRIGIYDAEKNLVGYKSDSFWHLSKDYWKYHSLEDGKIPAHLISNLQAIINKIVDNSEEYIETVLGALICVAHEHFASDTQSSPIVYIGFDEPFSADRVINYTHNSK